MVPATVDIGISLPATGPLATAEAIAAVAARAETLGFGSVWMPDHVAVPITYQSTYPYSRDGRPTFTAATPWLDPFLGLTVAATATSRVLLGTSVLILPLRPPLLVAKAAATLDHLSSGRAVLGVGSGWLREEFDLLGADFGGRSRRTTETIRILRACWGPDPVDFGDGRPFGMSPKPLRGAALQVVGGGHSDAALRCVATVCDGWQPIIDPDGFASRRAVLERLTADAERDISELWLSVRPGRGNPLSRDLLQRYADAGATTVLASPDYTAGLDAALHHLGRIATLAKPA